jgi:hypothetical protein
MSTIEEFANGSVHVPPVPELLWMDASRDDLFWSSLIIHICCCLPSDALYFESGPHSELDSILDCCPRTSASCWAATLARVAALLWREPQMAEGWLGWVGGCCQNPGRDWKLDSLQFIVRRGWCCYPTLRIITYIYVYGVCVLCVSILCLIYSASYARHWLMNLLWMTVCKSALYTALSEGTFSEKINPEYSNAVSPCREHVRAYRFPHGLRHVFVNSQSQIWQIPFGWFSPKLYRSWVWTKGIQEF